MANLKIKNHFRPLRHMGRSILATTFIATTVSAQTADVSLPPVTITSGAGVRPVDLAGFGDYPLKELPMSVMVVDSAQISASGSRRLADLARYDASVTDAYNAPGYWDFLSIRGFTLDNRYNYRREGLPINAETSIPLDNKERVEILKGTSGIQAGTSAPGGMVNYMVKRPTNKDLRSARLEVTSRSSVLAAVDLGGRFGNDGVFGYRLNVAHEDLRPITQHLRGQRDLLALAADWRVSTDSLLQAELEWSHKSQPSQLGYSLLGSTLPAAANPALNLNNQAWSQPSVFDALTGSLRWQQNINSDWRWSAQLGSQRLKTHDRLAYGFGCSAENNYDRYCSDGTFDLYDFRSEHEKRTLNAATLKLQGKVQAAGLSHDLSLGLTHSQLNNRFQMQAYNYVGTGNVQGTQMVPADPTLTDQNTNRDEKSLELSVQDVIQWTPTLSTWLGMRSTSLARDSIRTDGSRATHYTAALNTPWLAVHYALDDQKSIYASYGEGLESQVVPNKMSQYVNAGVALAPLKSRQLELGIKGNQKDMIWQVNAFRISRPMSNLDACVRLGITPCTGQYDGEAVHTGLEANGQINSGAWRLSGGVTLLDAKRKGSMLEPSTNGQRPTNVPTNVLRAQTAWRVPGMAGLEWQTQWQREGNRAVLPDNSIMLPAWNRFDSSVRYAARMGATATTWTLGIDNLTNHRHWQEAPYQYGHVYLFPAAARTFRLAVQASL
jgi:iron complex outermembrane receptor protein